MLIVEQPSHLMSIAAKWPKTRPARAFTVTELLITIACIALLAAILLPALAKSNARVSRINCANNMKQIGLAFRTFALDNNDRLPMRLSVTNGGTMELATSGLVYPHFLVMSNELSTPKILLCPEDKTRSSVFKFDIDLTDRNLSYFLNVDATNDNGSNLLSGDRNITNRTPAGSRLVAVTKADTIAWTKDIHLEKGHLLFGDGSVASFKNGSVSAAIQIADRTTNWLAVP